MRSARQTLTRGTRREGQGRACLPAPPLLPSLGAIPRLCWSSPPWSMHLHPRRDRHAAPVPERKQEVEERPTPSPKAASSSHLLCRRPRPLRPHRLPVCPLWHARRTRGIRTAILGLLRSGRVVGGGEKARSRRRGEVRAGFRGRAKMSRAGQEDEREREQV